MIIYEDEELVIPVGLAHSLSVDDIVNNEAIAVTITENGTRVLTPDAPYTGFSRVTIDTSVNITTQDKAVDSSTEAQRISADAGYDALGEVTVLPYVLDTPKTLDSSTNPQVILPVNDGLSKVIVNPYVLDTPKTVDSSTNRQVILPENDGLSKVTVNGYTDCYTKLFEAAPLDAPVNAFGPQTISITADNLRGLKNLEVNVFSGNDGMWINRFYDITFPDTLESLRSYPFSDNMYHKIDFYDTNIINWPGPFEDMATAYPQFFRSKISSIVFPRKMRSFISRSAYVINECTIDTIDLNPCQNLYNIDMLVQGSTVKSIIIPASCGEIKYLASNCTQLTDIYCYATTPPRVSILAQNIGTGGVLHVPSGSKERYEQSDWMSNSSEYSLAHYNWTVVEDL